jgi:hypothetical protein
VAAIPARRCRVDVGGCDEPAPVIGRAQQRSEARTGVEARPAEPVDRSGPCDKRRRLAVADQRVVFNPSRCLPLDLEPDLTPPCFAHASSRLRPTMWSSKRRSIAAPEGGRGKGLGVRGKGLGKGQPAKNEAGA